MAKITGAAVAAAAVVLASVTSVASAADGFDIGGYWDPILQEDIGDRGPGAVPGDFAGLPINDAGRMRGDTHSGALLNVPERQCIPHNAIYSMRSVGTAQVWITTDLETQQVTKINMNVGFSGFREIWMDGRAHPPESAAHTWQGFSTGRWEGDQLVVKTTHLKSSYLTRNGLTTSDRAVQEERFFVHDDVLNLVSTVIDPVYLSEPLVRTTVFVRRIKTPAFSYPCRPAVEIPRPRGTVPHNELGDSSASTDYARQFNLPIAGVRGGAATALPEFMDSPAAKVLAKPEAKK